MIQTRPLRREELPARLSEVAALRIEVFRAWPYLYDGDAAYEETYLQPYLDSDASVIVGAFDGDRLIGASTGAPLSDHADDFAAAFEGTGIDLSTVFYCAESVLLPGYRGHGIGHAFFDYREAHARALGFSACAFCSVMRPDTHPARPDAYRKLDPFWRGRGYAPVPGAIAEFSWKDLGDAKETRKPLQVWMRQL